ncbi:MSHA biogenesis protein MshN [Duganella sp. 1411]|uniref:tetratricopeptide repeat protein n=1 Tax=Duganella sp. 1411 TaxID=2806572 RepID=UPI001B3E2479|nr:tetratricopeptide repeat protein [Duganella sp. 1411]MBP1204419.1 MSHA biogenesis protein MshN [Duganella sp. 1411]
MSLINKMLQDLDKRGGAGDGVVHPQELKAVPPPERERRPLLLAGAGVAAAVLAAGGWYGWQYWQGHRAPPAPAPRVVLDQLPPGARRAPPPAPAAQTAPKPIAAPPTAETIATPAPAPEPAEPVSAAAPPARRPAKSMPVAAESGQPPASKPARSMSDEPVAARPRRAAPDADARRVEQPEGVSRREQTPKLESDGAYRRALVALQEGRLSVALADLERALEIDPRNEAARQTYVSLLLENKRTDEAIRQLRLSLGIDPRQPGLAMVLARLQLERGGPALETLMKTLPYAGDRADYLAFLAGVLQREQRHAEAARYYRDALQLAPGNGVWWMGLGISLQADQHLPEAREAFQRARQANGLTPELQAFIERRLEQLSR